MEAKLYILVRNDIPLGDQAVQACHAAEMWTYFNDCGDNSSGRMGSATTVLLSVEDEIHLLIWKRKAEQHSLDVEVFQEPNMSNSATAIACLTDKNLFDKLLLWPVLMPDGIHHLHPKTEKDTFY